MCFTTFLRKFISSKPKEGKHTILRMVLASNFSKIKNIYVSIKLMSNMVHDKYVQQRGICTCTHIANKCHKYFTDSKKKFAVSNTN